jgi:hypothetical protein
MFSLDKWYLDLVTGDGIALIGYAAELRWHALHLRYAAVLESHPGTPPHERATIRRIRLPEVAGDRLAWDCAPLHLQGEWRTLAPAIGSTLLEGPAGTITWSCLMPRARATVECGSARYEGLGYVERLQLTLPPWELPFRALRWGRHLSEGHALVWIEWDGELTRRWAWLDGRPQPSARVAGDGVEGLEGGWALRWQRGRDLRRRSVLETLREAAPLLVQRATGRLGTMDEHKQLSRSALVADGAELDSGWAIHEEVSW